MNVQVIRVQWRHKEAGIVGVAEVDLVGTGLRLHSVTIAACPGRAPYADLPRRPAYGADGQPLGGREVRIISFRKPEQAAEFSEAVLAQVEAMYPGKMAEGSSDHG